MIQHRRIEYRMDMTDTAAVRAFVARSDSIGAPGDDAVTAYWESVEFFIPDWMRARAAALHPLSRDYFELQDQLYRFLIDGIYAADRSEFTAIDKEAAVAGRLAYPGRRPRELNKYMRAHAKMADHIDSDEACDILEVGSGWGFSTEYLARLGHRVTAVDINPDFVDVATRRSAKSGLDIDYRLGSFDDLPLRPEERFDVIYCFEAFHHARDFVGTLHRFAQRLRPQGQFILFGEPFIPPSMWPNWGLRTDPLSVYCIARFGWWEAGWTHGFMSTVFRTGGLSASFTDDGNDLERYLVGRFNRSFEIDQVSHDVMADGWTRDRDYLICRGNSRIEFHRPLRKVMLEVEVFAPMPLSVRFESVALAQPVQTELHPGRQDVTLPLTGAPASGQWDIKIISQTWNPAAVIGAGADDQISFHLRSLHEAA